MPKEYKCEICDKNYASYQTMYQHNKNLHHDLNIKIGKVKPNKLQCEYCKKILSRIDSLTRHTKSCSKKNEHDDKKKILTEIVTLKKEIKELKETKKVIPTKIINYNNFGNMPINNIMINKIGTENINDLTEDEIKNIFQRELGCVVALIDTLNFNKRLRSNHSYCNTSLESRFMSVYNHETKKIDKDRKKYFFEQLITKSIDNIAKLYNDKKHIFEKKKQKSIEDNIKTLQNVKDYSFCNRIVKSCINELNLVTYNKREMIQETWQNINNNPKIDYDSESDFEKDLEKEDDRKFGSIRPNKINNNLNDDDTDDDESVDNIIVDNLENNKNIKKSGLIVLYEDE